MEQKPFSRRVSNVLWVAAAFMCYLTEFYLRGSTCGDLLGKVDGDPISPRDKEGTAQSQRDRAAKCSSVSL